MSKKTMIIGISGASASGKTLLANTIVRELGSKEVAVLSEDAYYKNLGHLSLEERSKMNFDHPTQRESLNFDHPDSLDHELLHQHLTLLQNGQSVEVPQYDFETHSRHKETRHVGKHTIIVLEGILLFIDPKLRAQMDIRIFMDTPLDICFIRRLLRDTKERGRSFDSVVDQYLETVRPMYFQFIEPSKRHADIIVPRGGENRIAIEVIKAKMRELLGTPINSNE